MSAENDAGRDIKKTGLLIAAALFCVVAFGFILVSWMSTPPQPASRINVDKAAGGSGKVAPESPQYREILRANNEEGAKQAQAANTSFIASVGTSTTPAPLPAPPPPSPPQQSAPAHQYVQQQQTTQPGVDPDRKKALEALIKELVAQRTAPMGQVASITGMVADQTGSPSNGQLESPYAQWTNSLMPEVTPAALTSNETVQFDRVIIPAGSRPGAIVDTAVDSDNTRSQVLAHIPAGPYAGATFMASGVQLAGDGVSIHFTSMIWNEATWRVNVWAAMPDTLQSSVASSVNNRYATRIILPALANGLGLAGQLYASANTQILSNGYNTLEGRVGMPDGKAVAGTILGGAAQQAGQVISNDAQKLPVKQVLVERGQSIALIFMTAVKESDKETRTPADITPPSLRIQQPVGN